MKPPTLIVNILHGISVVCGGAGTLAVLAKQLPQEYADILLAALSLAGGLKIMADLLDRQIERTSTTTTTVQTSGPVVVAPPIAAVKAADPSATPIPPAL